MSISNHTPLDRGWDEMSAATRSLHAGNCSPLEALAEVERYFEIPRSPQAEILREFLAALLATLPQHTRDVEVF